MGIALTTVLGRPLTVEEADGNIADLDARVRRFETEGLEARGLDEVVYDDVARTLTLRFTDDFEYEFPMPPAQLALLGDWISGVAYERYDSVGHEGAWYVCPAAHLAGASFEADLSAGKWQLIARAGRDAIRHRGTYGGGVTYEVFDAVAYTDGLVYQLLYPVPAGSPPGTTVTPPGFPPGVQVAAWSLVNGAQRRPFRAWTDGKPVAGKALVREIVDRITFLKAGLAGSYARLGVAPAATLSLALTVNGVTKGSLSFAANAVQGTFTLAQDVLLMAGDVLAVMGPGSADAAASDLTLSIAGTQT